MLLASIASIAQDFLASSLGKIISRAFRNICLLIDSVVYSLISWLYRMFTFLSQIRIFENEQMKDLARRMYILIGVISLFLVAYALINAIINPDNASKDKNASFSGIIKNITIALIGIALVPTIFDYAYEFQRIVLCDNVIPKFFSVTSSREEGETNFSNEMSLNLFQSFFYVKNGAEVVVEDKNGNIYSSILSDDGVTLKDAFESVKSEEKSLSEALGNFDEAFDKGQLGYIFVLSTACGIFVAYVLLNFVIDIALRSVKLSYLQLIAPLPIMTLVIPNQKKIFDNWLTKTTSCFFEVFVRVIVITFGAYAVRYLPKWVFSGDMTTCGDGITGIILLLSKAAFIVGIFAFLKQAPKLIGELLPGVDSSGFKLGIGDKLGEMALIGDAAKSGFQRTEGAITGGLGGLATGLGNRDKIGLKSAVMQGATQGFKDKGNQFSKQRKKTFQSIGEYKDKDQGFLGGESKVNKFINDHKKDVEKDYGEKANIKKSDGEASDRYGDTKNHFTQDEINDRIKSFKNSDEYKAAELYAAERMQATGERSAAVREAEIKKYLENLKTNTTDKNLKRKITQFENDNATAEKLGALDEKKKAYEASQQRLTDAQFLVANNNSRIDEINSNLNSKKGELRGIENELVSNQKALDDNEQQALAEKAKLDAAISKIESIHPELKDELSGAKDYTELKKVLDNLKIKLDAEDRAAGGMIFGNGRTELNQAYAAIESYDSTTSKKSQIENERSTILDRQKQAQDDCNWYTEKIEELKHDNEKLGANDDYKNIRKKIKDDKESYEQASAEFVNQVNISTEAVYNGDASLKASGEDDLTSLSNEFKNALKNGNGELAVKLYKQIKIMEKYRGAKQGINDMNQSINYEKELYNYFKNQKKDS